MFLHELCGTFEKSNRATVRAGDDVHELPAVAAPMGQHLVQRPAVQLRVVFRAQAIADGDVRRVFPAGRFDSALLRPGTDWDREFAFGLDVLLDGFEARLSGRR